MHSGLQKLAEDFKNGRITRRELTWRASGFVGGLALTSFLAACGADDENAPANTPTPTTADEGDADEPTATSETGAQPTEEDGSEPEEPAGEGKPGGTFTFPIIADPVFNPLLSSGVQSVMVNKVLFNGLVKPEPGTLQPVPDLAESWEPNEDFTEWTFQLRQDVQWHDGEPFTADDVVFTYDRRMNEEGVSAAFKELTACEKVDDYTVRFTLSEPLGHFPVLMSYNQFIVPKHILEGKTMVDYTEFSIENPVGTGPYMFEEFIAGNYVSTVKNPNFHLGEPLIDRFVFTVLPDVNSQVAQLRTGELTFATIEPVNVQTLEGVQGLVIDPIDYVNHYYIAFQCPRPPFDDARVRLALALAIDRQAIVDSVTLGYGTIATSTIPTALEWAFNDELDPMPYDPDRALEILAEAGWEKNSNGILEKDGEPLAFTLSCDRGNPAREQTVTIVQQMFNDLGCEVDLELMDWGSFSQQRWLAEDYEAMHMWWITAPDPDQLEYYGCDGDNNHPNFCNEEITEILTQARQTADMEERRKLYYRYQELTMEDPPVAVLYYPKEIRVYPDKLKGVPNIGIRDAFIYSYQMWLDD
ncbi:MAG TPA: ABC transporter substrate-binding protein [Thermomicrobiales bacterium]|nr:ABC transporter substrate-binding protein [Thermomicrobiales bacterium]